MNTKKSILALAEKNWTPFLIALICVTLSFLWHMTEDSDSMLNTKNHRIANEEIAAIIDAHKTVPAFAQRPLTTLIIEKVAHATGVGLGVSFALINFSFLFISGLLLYRLALIQVTKRSWALLSMLVYFFCFSNLYLFFPPIYGYDEPLQFCLILLGFIALVHRKWIVYLIAFTLALVARESSSILIPGFVYLVWAQRDRVTSRIPIVFQWLIVILPIVFHAVFVVVFLKWNGIQKEAIIDFWDRFEGFKVNTETPQAAIESLTSLFLVIGLPVYFLWSHLRRNRISPEKWVFVRAFLITLVINTVVVMTVTKAREARLFAIPLFFLWPILGELLVQEFGMLFQKGNYKRLVQKWTNGLIFLMLLGLNYVFSFFCYNSTVSGDSDHYFNEYLFISLIVVTIHGLMTTNGGISKRILK